MKILSAAFVMVMLAGPAYAQDQSGGGAPHINMLPEVASKTPEEKEADEQRDKAYKESLKKIPNAKASADPWGNVRSTDAPKTSVNKTPAKTTSAKTPAPAKPTKTGSTVN